MDTRSERKLSETQDESANKQKNPIKKAGKKRSLFMAIRS